MKNNGKFCIYMEKSQNVKEHKSELGLCEYIWGWLQIVSKVLYVNCFLYFTRKDDKILFILLLSMKLYIGDKCKTMVLPT